MNAAALKLVLRVLGTSSLLAIPCAFLPFSWMDTVHRWLGMGTLLDQPVVGYLARSLSLFYGLLGGLLWVVSFDLRRHRRISCYLGAAIAIFGLFILGVDLAEGLPRFWSLWEGPFDMLVGLIILWLSCRLPSQDPDGSDAGPLTSRVG